MRCHHSPLMVPEFHENADMIELFEEAKRPDLIATLNTFESSFMWLKKQLAPSEKESA